MGGFGSSDIAVPPGAIGRRRAISQDGFRGNLPSAVGVEKGVNSATIRAERERLRALLRELRLKAGLRQADLAERRGAPQSWVS
jgi:hypothetical protein